MTFQCKNNEFIGAVRDEWGYNNWNSPVYIYGGTLTFNGQANSSDQII